MKAQDLSLAVVVAQEPQEAIHLGIIQVQAVMD
jgi:hypothetical protein